jgi:PKD repeat protein
MSAKGRKAQIYVYGTGAQNVTVTSPYGTDVFANVPAGQTVSKVLTGYSAAPPVADFVAIPLSGWNTYVAPEFISFSSGWITDYLWEFGDGQWSTELAPHHKYSTAGIYTVKLTVAGPGGSSSATKSNYITINDFANYNWPDYIIASPTNAFAAFTSALQSIEASQTQHYTEKPEWCHNGSWTPWCDVVSTLQGHGGGGRILFSFSNTTIYGSWDGRIDPIKTWGDSNNKYDFVGDNLIIDGENKNVGFYYNGSLSCGQAENQQAFRIHGCDNIVRNIGWSRFPDGIHMRHGMRMLFEGITTTVVCEDAMSMNGVGGACMYCTQRNNTFGASADKTQMYSNAQGWRGLGPGIAVICGMHSTNGNQAIRQTSSEGGTRSMLIVRNSLFEGDAQGPRIGGKMDSKPPIGISGAVNIFENNYCTESKSGSVGGMRIGEGIHAIVRNNTFENCGAFGVYTYPSGAFVRFEYNIIRNNEAGGLTTGGCDGIDINYDLGGGLVDVWEVDPTGIYGASAAARVAAPSAGQNTFNGNGVADFINEISESPQPAVKAENNFWDHSTVADVLANDVSGAADVDPLGVNPNSP